MRPTVRLVASLALPAMALAPAGPAAASPPSPADVSGSWNWSRVEQLTFPAWVATDIIGIQPEGPTTVARCQGSGTMSLIQADASFTGTFVQTAQECTTQGGQAFQDPAAFVPVAIDEGRIRGQSIGLLLDGVVVDCLYHAVISEVQAGVALALAGVGRCIVPGHPKSELPLDPPPAGTSTTLSWEAWRP